MIQVYRTFIVWNFNFFVIALPFLLFLADSGMFFACAKSSSSDEKSAMGIVACYTLSKLTSNEVFYAKLLSSRTQAFYSLTVSVNVICSRTSSIHSYLED